MTDPLLVCRCGEATAPDAEDVAIWLAAHAAKPHRVATDRNRMPCSPPAGCRRCGEPARGRFIFYCSPECSWKFSQDHWWGDARNAALTHFERNDKGHVIERIARRCVQADDTCAGLREVNHITPLNGDRPSWGCVHHQKGLEVLCHSHHVRETRAQKRDGRIGTAESAARLRAGDVEREDRTRRRDERQETLERRQAMREAMNPRMFS